MISINNIKKEYLSCNNILESNNLDSFYDIFKVKKHKWWYRDITAPNKDLACIQRLLKFEIEEEINSWSIIYGNHITWFTKWKNLLDNASFHTNKKYLLNIDIKWFFSSIAKEIIYNNFKDIVDDIDLFIKLTTYKWILPQWSPCSPIIANIVFMDVDFDIIDFLIKNNFINSWYSRYADDISISYDNPLNKNKLIYDINKIIEKHNFTLNTNKTNFYNNKTKMIVTGLVVNKRIAYPKYNYRLLRSILFNLLEKWFWYFPQIKGLLSFLKSVDVKKYNVLKKTYWKKFKDNNIYYEIFDIDIKWDKIKNRPINFLWKNSDKDIAKEIYDYIQENREYHKDWEKETEEEIDKFIKQLENKRHSNQVLLGWWSSY